MTGAELYIALAEARDAAAREAHLASECAAEMVLMRERWLSARAELEVVKTERDLAVLTLAAFTPADKPLPTLPNQFPSSAGVHTCHAECPCQHGGRPSPDFLTNEGADT